MRCQREAVCLHIQGLQLSTRHVLRLAPRARRQVMPVKVHLCLPGGVTRIVPLEARVFVEVVPEVKSAEVEHAVLEVDDVHHPPLGVPHQVPAQDVVVRVHRGGPHPRQPRLQLVHLRPQSPHVHRIVRRLLCRVLREGEPPRHLEPLAQHREELGGGILLHRGPVEAPEEGGDALHHRRHRELLVLEGLAIQERLDAPVGKEREDLGAKAALVQLHQHLDLALPVDEHLSVVAEQPHRHRQRTPLQRLDLDKDVRDAPRYLGHLEGLWGQALVGWEHRDGTSLHPLRQLLVRAVEVDGRREYRDARHHSCMMEWGGGRRGEGVHVHTRAEPRGIA
mmetsp:Transcript_39386/g.125688  ORF Transcript_39386/g.125688 Transcript_39386/m.125688 type:complete len:336 (+) Transcript_39386:1741-2748(+)